MHDCHTVLMHDCRTVLMHDCRTVHMHDCHTVLMYSQAMVWYAGQEVERFNKAIDDTIDDIARKELEIQQLKEGQVSCVVCMYLHEKAC